MSMELQQEATVHELELKDTCVGCGGVVFARFRPGSARGVCLGCHLVTAMTMVRAGEGVRVVQWPSASA